MKNLLLALASIVSCVLPMTATSPLPPESCTDGNRPFTRPLDEIGFYFDGDIKLLDGAKAVVICGDETVATASRMEVSNYTSSKRTQGTLAIFFDGQIFDAYAFVANLIRKAKHRIVVIDSYVDDSVLVQLSKRNPGVTVDIYDGKISQLLRQDVARHNAQYPGVTLHAYNKAHDRFLIIDEEVYHIGHSLKDLGKKLFAFSKMDVMTGSELMSQL